MPEQKIRVLVAKPGLDGRDCGRLMDEPPVNTARLREDLARVIGPAPWYWKTFPALISAAGQRFLWTYHGESGPLAYLVSLALEREPDKPRLALNTYARPF